MNRAELKDKLTQLAKVYAMSGGITGKDMVAFKEDHIIADNGIYFMQVPFEHDLDCILPAVELHKIVSKSKDTEVSITQKDDDFYIETGRISALLAPPARAKFMKTKIRNYNYTALPELEEPIKYCMKTVVKDNLAYSNLQILGNKMYSTDTSRISVFALGQEVEDELYINSDVFSVIKSNTPTGYHIDGRTVYYLLSDGTVLGMNNYVGGFSDLTQFTDVTEDHFLNIDAEETLDELTAVTAITRDTKKDDQVCVLNINGGVRVTAAGVSGKFSVLLCENTNDFTAKCKINPHHLIDGLKLGADIIWSHEGVLIFNLGDFRQYCWMEVLT